MAVVIRINRKCIFAIGRDFMLYTKIKNSIAEYKNDIHRNTNIATEALFFFQM